MQLREDICHRGVLGLVLGWSDDETVGASGVPGGEQLGERVVTSRRSNGVEHLVVDDRSELLPGTAAAEGMQPLGAVLETDGGER